MPRDALLAAALPRRPRLRATLLRWTGIARQRRQLARLDDAALRDMGLSRADIAHEIRRMPWDAPAHWKG